MSEIMDNGAAAFLRRTIVLIIRSSPLLTRLLWQSEELQLDVDLECQYTTLPSDERREDRQKLRSNSEQPFMPTGRDTPQDYVRSDDPESRIEPLDEPTRIILHDDGAKKRLALLVTEDLVFRTQKVINHLKGLLYHEKYYQNVEKKIVNVERLIKRTTENLEISTSEDETEELRKEFERQEASMQNACARRDALGRDLNICRMNLVHAKDASHSFLLEILGNAGLLELPQAESEPDQDPDLAGLADSDAVSPKAKSIVMDEEESFRQSVWRELGERSNELEEAERIFNNLDAVYEEQAEEYEAEFTRGEISLARSEFDRMFLDNNMRATTRLIQAEKAFKASKRQAKALSVVASDWGDDVGYGEYEAPSVASDEFREYNASRDWSFVQNWVEDLPDIECLHTPESQLEEVEIDDWDARLDDMWDSISAVDHGEESRDNHELWEEICGGSGNDYRMDDDLSQEQGDDLSQMEECCEPEEDLSPMEETHEQERNLSLMEE